MKAIQIKVINLSLVLTLLAVTLFSFTPQIVNAREGVATVPCLDKHDYEDGEAWVRQCVPCTWIQVKSAYNNATCTVEYGGNN